MQTDLARILSVAGLHGLFQYVAQSRSGVIAESLESKQRKAFSATSRISTLADIAIYMRKVIDWYDQIVKYASLDFVKEEEQADGQDA